MKRISEKIGVENLLNAVLEQLKIIVLGYVEVMFFTLTTVLRD